MGIGTAYRKHDQHEVVEPRIAFDVVHEVGIPLVLAHIRHDLGAQGLREDGRLGAVVVLHVFHGQFEGSKLDTRDGKLGR